MGGGHYHTKTGTGYEKHDFNNKKVPYKAKRVQLKVFFSGVGDTNDHIV